MSVDENAFCDRLYADALSAGLRSSAAFYRARVRVAWEDIETYVRDRATAHTTDLSATPAEAERALEDTYTRWREIGSGDGPLQQINLLTRAARKLLQPDGREMILRVDRKKPGREIL